MREKGQATGERKRDRRKEEERRKRSEMKGARKE